MSGNLVWEPVDRKKTVLPTELKFVLRKRYSEPLSATFTEADLEYLKGLMDADVRGASELIEAIEKYGEINVYEEY